MKVISCPKCSYSRREKIEKNQDGANENEPEMIDEIDILNKLDEQNDKS